MGGSQSRVEGEDKVYQPETSIQVGSPQNLPFAY